MSVRRVLYLTAGGLTVHRLRDGRRFEAFAFPSSAEGVEGFGRYLTEGAGDPTWLLADLIEEEFRLEHLPHVGHMERRELLERHARRLYPTTPFRSAMTLGREQEGRRDDRVLVSALTNPDRLKPWLERLQAARAPLFAISSAAHVSAALAAGLGLHAPCLLLVTEGESAGLRQSFFHLGEVRVSRLTPWPEGGMRSGEFIRDEIARTRHYLDRSQWLPGDTPLHVAVLGHGPRLDQVRELVLPPDVELHPMELTVAASRMKCAGMHISCAEELLVQLFARDGRNRYAQPPHLASRHRYHLRKALALGGASSAAALLLLAARNGVEATMDYRATALAEAQIGRYERLLASEEGIPSSTLKPEQMKEVVETLGRLALHDGVPEKGLARLGRELHFYPEFRLRRIRWAAFLTGPANKSEETDAGTNAFLPPDALSRRHHALTVEGEVSAKSDSGNLDTRFAQFITGLRQGPDVVEVEIMQAPVSPRDSADHGRRDSMGPAMRFSFRVVVRS